VSCEAGEGSWKTRGSAKKGMSLSYEVQEGNIQGHIVERVMFPSSYEKRWGDEGKRKEFTTVNPSEPSLPGKTGGEREPLLACTT